ncbi:MAG TPA: hypothetical protein VFD59_14370 [Nocardioidaceae bacterium]|nr:hypothetical protein [Nocardioidaceae bacterium]
MRRCPATLRTDSMEVLKKVFSAVPARFRLLVGTLLIAVVAGAAACTGSSEEPPPPAAPSGSSTAATPDATPEVRMDVQVTRVSGRLAKPRRSGVERAVGRTISAYSDAAFVAGDLSKSASSVNPRSKKASLSVLAANGAAAGVTAHIRLVSVVERGEARPLRVTTSGRLLLTKGSGRWEIFGYDVTRSALPLSQAVNR